MAYDRTGTGPWAWLKSVGTQEEPLKADWRVGDDHLLTSVWFSKHPRSIRGGDILVYYAARHQVLPAIVEVVSDEVHDDGGARFRYRMEVRALVTVGLRDAPSLGDTTISPTSVRRQSHIYLTPEQFRKVRKLIIDKVGNDVDGLDELPAAA